MFPFRFFSDLLEDKLSSDQVNRAALFLLIFVTLLALVSIFTTPSMSARESIYFETVEGFLNQPGAQAGNLGYFVVNKYVSSLPLRLTADLGLTTQLIAMRLFGLVFLLITLWLAYQTTKRVFPGLDFIPLATLALLATNNHLLTSAITISGNIFHYLLFTLIIYLLVEVASKGALFDVFISMAVLFVLSRIDPITAELVVLPLMFFVLMIALISTYKEQLIRLIPDSNQIRLAMTAGVVIVLIMLSRIFEPVAIWLKAPASIGPAIIGLPGWPHVAIRLAKVFGDSPLLSAGFAPVQALIIYLFQITAVVALAGLIHFIYTIVDERIKVVRTPPPESDSEAGSSTEFVIVKPESSILTSINVPALLAIVFIPLTAIASRNGYAIAVVINEGLLFILLLPLAMLVAAGIRQLSSVKSAEAVGYLCLLGVLTINLGGIVIPILWR